MLEAMLKDICGSDLFSSIYETLSINWFSSGAALTAARTLHNTIKPVALMLMFLYFMIAIVDKLSSENFTWEQLWRQMAMLLAAKYLIDNCFDILKLMFDIGMAAAATLSSKYGTNVSSVTINAQTLIDGFRQSMGFSEFFSFLAEMLMVLYLLLPWLLSWIMRLCVSIVCYSRVIEIYCRAVFAPLAISDFFHTGLQGGGWRFLKNFLAVCLQGAMILVIAIIYSKLFASLTVNEPNLFVFIGKYLAFYASAVMLMFKSLSLTKEVLGTG